MSLSVTPARDGLPVLVVEDVNQAVQGVLRELLDRGSNVVTQSAAGGRPAQSSRELIAHHLVLKSPRKRILTIGQGPLRAVDAAARLAWEVGGSDRVADISHYVAGASRFTDNGLSMPGSNYGERLFQPRPNLDQLRGVVQRLSLEGGTRRAAAVVWSPEDATRESQDIPCLFGFTFLVRDSKLTTICFMRSNNAYTLLPVNLFEFTLLSEMVARAIGVELGDYHHFTSSMHLFERDFELAKSVIADARGQPELEMPPMPPTPDPFLQAREFSKLEARTRTNASDLVDGEISQLIEHGTEVLSDYWMQFYRVLLAWNLAKVRRWDDARFVADQLPLYFRGSVLRDVDTICQQLSEPTRPVGQHRFTVDGQWRARLPSSDMSPTSGEEDPGARFDQWLIPTLMEVEVNDGITPTLTEFADVRRQLLPSLAGHERAPVGSPLSSSPRGITQVDVRSALRQARTRAK
ncbi:MAG TPA: thymidylate synthase [Thermoplasmata archaeon]|nr:thymidylate synthase [Thermoplasmata archaeon]